ncbi:MULTISPECIES: hypothetical protein [unclassified Microcoleus]
MVQHLSYDANTICGGRSATLHFFLTGETRSPATFSDRPLS